MDKEYFNVLNGEMNCKMSGKEYSEFLTTKANQTLKPLTLKLRMKQMKIKMEEEINISKIKHENKQYQQNNDQKNKNIFFLYKKRTNKFNNNQKKHNSEAKSSLTQRNFTQYSPQGQKQEFNKTMLPSSPIINNTTKTQNFKDFVKLNKQIKKYKGQQDEQVENQLEQKDHIEKSLKESCVKVGINSYDQALKNIQEIKQNITEKVIKECDTIYQQKQDQKLNILEKTQTHFIRVLDVIKGMDEQLFQYMLNYKFKNQINDQFSILEDINKMRDDSYNDKVRTFSKYHDIDQEKKRDRQKLNKIKVYF